MECTWTMTATSRWSKPNYARRCAWFMQWLEKHIFGLMSRFCHLRQVLLSTVSNGCRKTSERVSSNECGGKQNGPNTMHNMITDTSRNCWFHDDIRSQMFLYPTTIEDICPACKSCSITNHVYKANNMIVMMGTYPLTDAFIASFQDREHWVNEFSPPFEGVSAQQI